MVKYVEQGNSIEGEKVLVNTRKQITQQPVVKKGKLLNKYACSRNSQAEITEELSPKKCVIKDSSHLEIGDLLEAKAIDVFTTDKKFHFSKEANYSSTHSIQTAESKGFTFAEISIPFRYILERAAICNS